MSEEGIIHRTKIWESDSGKLKAQIERAPRYEGVPHVRLTVLGATRAIEADTAHLIGRALMEHAEALGVEHDTSEFPEEAS